MLWVQFIPSVFLLGPPGAGKSTTAKLLASKNDFLYYEGDCTMGFMNPFMDPKSEKSPMLQFLSQPPLKVSFMKV